MPDRCWNFVLAALVAVVLAVFVWTVVAALQLQAALDAGTLTPCGSRWVPPQTTTTCRRTLSGGTECTTTTTGGYTTPVYCAATPTPRAISPQGGPMFDSPKPKPADWKTAVAAAAQAERDHWAAALLARSGIPPERAVYTQESPVRMTAEVDGETFRLVRSPFGRSAGFFGDHLMLVRPCASCGQGTFVSGWVDSPAALGAALEHFHPRCSSCRYLGKA